MQQLRRGRLPRHGRDGNITETTIYDYKVNLTVTYSINFQGKHRYVFIFKLEMTIKNVEGRCRETTFGAMSPPSDHILIQLFPTNARKAAGG